MLITFPKNKPYIGITPIQKNIVLWILIEVLDNFIQ